VVAENKKDKKIETKNVHYTKKESVFQTLITCNKREM